MRRLLSTLILFAGTVVGLSALANPAAADTPEVQLTLAPTTVEPGNPVHVDVTLNNVNGFTVLGPAALVLTGPADITSFTTLTGCDAAGGCATGGFAGSVGYEGILPESIPGGGSATVGFDLMVSPQATPGTYVFSGQLVGSNYASQPVSGPSLTVQAPADAAVAITATPRVGLLDSSVAVKVTVRDQGPGSLTGATVAVALPRYATATSSDCAVAGGAVTCLIGAIPAGGSASASFLLPVKPLALGPLVLTAKRTASTPRDPNSANDAASVRCNVLTRLIITCDSR